MALSLAGEAEFTGYADRLENVNEWMSTRQDDSQANTNACCMRRRRKTSDFLRLHTE